MWREPLLHDSFLTYGCIYRSDTIEIFNLRMCIWAIAAAFQVQCMLSPCILFIIKCSNFYVDVLLVICTVSCGHTRYGLLASWLSMAWRDLKMRWLFHLPPVALTR